VLGEACRSRRLEREPAKLVIEHTVIAAGGRALRVAEYGDLDGRPVLVHHGSPGCRLVFDHDMDKAYEQGIRLISYDRPGYGGSDRLPSRVVGDCAASMHWLSFGHRSCSRASGRASCSATRQSRSPTGCGRYNGSTSGSFAAASTTRAPVGSDRPGFHRPDGSSRRGAGATGGYGRTVNVALPNGLAGDVSPWSNALQQKAPHLRGLSQCAREDSNLHGLFAHKALNLARLPIPPQALGGQRV
jgi:pimeloyl-ACP methyl ester carboxylesterase